MGDQPEPIMELEQVLMLLFLEQVEVLQLEKQIAQIKQLQIQININ